MDVRQLAFLARQPSAALKEREHFWGLPKRGIALILANAMFWQPMWAQADGIVVSGAGTGLAQAGNGVPIVNIATPNATGLSHNQFQQYNVDAQGLILNNIAQQTGATQLGGIIVGNPNMNNGVAAQVILNEVVGANASQLKGYTEVAGQAARVIVANPYGITCNGCGFLNTPQVTLTTGKPVLDSNGGLVRFNVQNGSVAIEGLGLNADNVDQFDIITRSAKINAELQAKKLNIIAGRNDVDAQTLSATALADDGSAKPELAIDSSALGGMYVGAVKLVGTEAGVGVRLASNVAASAGDIQIDANGKLTLNQAVASGAVAVKANAVEVKGPLYAGTSLSVTTPGDLSIQQNVAARDVVTLSSTGQLTNTAIIEAGINADNSRNTRGDVVLSAGNLTNTGSVVASRALQATATQTLNNQGGTLSGQASTRVTATTLDNRQSGRILSQGGNVEVTASGVSNGQKGLISSAGALTINAASLDNQQGVVRSTGASTLTVTDAVVNQGGEVLSDAGLTLTSGRLDNSRSGRIAGKGVTVTTGAFDNHLDGRLTSTEALRLTAEQVNNSEAGRIASAMALTAVVTGLDLSTALLNNDQGVVRSEGTLTLNAGAVSNTAGSLTSAGTSTLTVTNAVANQGGEVLSDTGLTLTSGRLDNSRSGRIAGKGVTVTTGAFDNHLDGRLTSTGALGLTAAQVNNSEAGRIASAMALTAVVTGLDQHADGRLYSKGDVSLDLGNGHLNNQDGLITAPGQLLLTRLGTVNNQSGEISSAKGFTLAATSLDNTDGTVLSDEALIVRVDKALTNLRGLVSGKGVDLTAATLNNDSGEVSSEAGLTLDVTGDVSNRQGLLSSAASTTLEAQSLDNAEGQVMADEELTVILAQALDNQAGTLGAGLGLDLRAASLDNRLAGAVLTDGQLDITLTGTLDNRTGGQVQAKGMLTLTSQVLNNQGGRVVGQDLLTVHSDSALNRGGVIRADQLMKLFIGDLDNSQTGLIPAQTGVITSQAGLEFIGQRLDNQNGLLNAVGVMTLQADTLLNGAGRIASQSDLTATVDTVSQQGGELVAQGTLTLTGQRLDNQAGGLVGATKALKLTVDDIDNRAGEVSSQVGVELIGDRLDNRDGGKVLSGTALQLIVERVINENKGLLFGQTLTLDGKRLDNAGGTLASQQAQTLTLTGALDNRGGLLSSETALTVKADSLDNTGGTLSSAEALKVTTDGALINQSGSITTDAALTVVSASLDNSQKGKLSGLGATTVTTGAFDNSQGGQLTSSDTLELIAGKVINQSAGRIASALALTASVTSLDQQGGELFSNTTLSLDLNHGQLNNQGGLINSPGALLLKNLKAVDNQGGEISSAQAFTLTAHSLDNSGGKLLGSQGLTLDLVEFFRNLKGTVSATGLSIHSDSLDNAEGLISSRADLILTVDQALSNVKGTVIADGDLEVSAATGNNAQGEMSSKKALTAVIGNLQQQGGQLFALGALSLTGDTLNNSLKGFVGAGEALTLTVDDIDNQGGEISSQEGITLTGQTLTNTGGQVLAQQALTLEIAQTTTNRNEGVLSGKTGLTLTGASLDNTGGVISGLSGLGLDLSGALDNTQGLISSEGKLTIEAGSLTNTAGSVSSAGTLTLDMVGTLGNQGGELVTDDALTLTSTGLDNSQQGTVSAKGRVTIDTGDLDNSQKGRISSGERLDLTAAKLTNHGGSIASRQALVASVSSLEQQQGSLTSATSLSLDVNQGLLDNQGGLINAPGTLLLKNLKTVLNQGGEISSAQAFTLTAQSLDNSGGTLLSNQLLTLRIAQALNNVKGLIAAAGVDATAGSLDNTGGTLTSRNALDLTVTGQLTNRDKGLINAAEALHITSGDLNNRGGQLLANTALTLDSAALDTGAKGLINSQGTLTLTADSLSADTGGEVSALGAMTLVLHALSLDASRLIGNAGLSLDLNGADLNNRAGLITATGPLTVKQVRDVNNQGGEISSAQSFTLTARTLDNSGGQLISNNLLTLNADSLLNQNGLISGWQGLDVTATSLDNRNRGTLSSRNGAVEVDLSGALLNSGNGALVSQTALTVTADSLDNRGGILSSGTGQTLTVTGLLNNSQSGLIDSGADLTLTANALDNSAGTLISTGKATLDLIGALTNTGGKLASGGDWLLKRSSAVHNQGGQLISQRLMTLTTGLLDNSTTGTVAANGTLLITATGKVLNHTDGLIYSQNAGVELDAASLDNTRGAVQGQSTLKVEVGEGVDNLNGRLIAQNGDLTVEAARLDNRGGLLSSLKGLFTAQISGVLKNGYDLAANRQGGVIQAQRLSLTALGGFDNYGGRVSASTGEALLTTANLDNRNGGIYAKGLVRVIAKDLDNSGDNDGQIAGGQVDLRLTGDLNNRLGIIESDSTLAIKAASLDNQTGQIRSLGTLDAADFQIGTLFDNRRGTVEVANSNLILNAASFLNANGSLLHAGAGTFGLSTANLMQAGGNLVTRGGLTVTADSWTNSSVIQAGRLTVNVGTFNQTASGQLLASSAFVGTGGSWTNEGVIASDGTFELTLTGKYASNGHATSLGRLGLSAANVELLGAGRIAGASDVQVKSDGVLLNQGRITSARDLILNATSLTNNGTIGSAGKLDLVSQVLRNEGVSSGDQSLISSGGDMRLLVGDFTNRFATVYSLGSLLVAGDAALNRSNRIENISAALQSDGAMGLYGTTISNRKDAFSVNEQVVSGTITYQCLNCKGRHYDFFYYVTEEIARSVQADSASSSINAGGALKVQSSLFENKHSTVSAASSIDISTDNFNNEGASTESVLRTRQFRNPDDSESWSVWDDMVREGGVIAEYAKYNSKTKFVYQDEWYDNDGGGGTYPIDIGQQNTGVANPFYRPNSGYAVPAHVLTYWLYDSWETQTNTGVAANAVIQAGGAVNIAASKNLGNGVTRQNTGYSSLALNAANTQAGSQINPNTASINAQLPPDLAQQQVNPLALPGFSLPTGQNGLFRLSAQTGSNVAATQTSTAPQNWTLGSASVSVAQREQTVSDTQARTLQFGTAGQVSTATRQLADVVRQNSGLSANASAFDSSAPVDSATRLQLTGHSAGSTGMTPVADVTQVQSQNGNVPLPGQGATTVPVITPVASNTSTAQNGTTTSTAVPSTQVARVQALPGNTAPPNPHKYLIETNPVLTDLRQFMSSDYLLAGLGYDPEASAKRLGDGLYEQRLVQQAIVARTGQAFLAGQTSNEAQLKYLMNNAIASKEQLNLAIGVTLSSLQVAALTHDIVWLEEHEVNGEKVLVPVLYLAQANNRLGPTGALIAGNDVTLTAGKELDNVGTLRATNNLSATAGTNLVNTGLIEAGNRLDLLAGNDLINKAGGILYGRDVTLSATRGDVINERTVTRAVSVAGYQDFADSAARVESANDLTIKAGRDVMSIGGTLQAGRDLSLIAGRDVNIGAAQTETAKAQGANTQSSITQLGSSVSVGRDLMALSGRDINVVASDIDAKRDIAMAATENMTISSAADETHSLSRSKKLTVQTDHVKQVSADLNAGGSIALNAGQDLAVISSRITSGENANLSAGENLSLLAAQDSDYYLYDKKSKGSWGKKKTKRDEVTDIRNVGSEITSGGDLTLESGGDQLYQVAKLTSGNDLTLESGGGITFEGVKDLHDESHTKSNNDAFWTSSKGKGRTDETLRQTQMVAKGELSIKAVNGLKIDIKHIDQQTVSQTIDVMVQADPQLAWLKDAEKRGDVDWRQVKEIHESFKYSNSGLGPASQIIIAIALAAVMGPMMASFSTMAQAGAISVATKATVSTIDNRGNLGKVLKDVTSKDSIKGYAVAVATAGVADKLGYNPATASVKTAAIKTVADATIKTAVYGGSFTDNLVSAAAGTAASIGGAAVAGKIGDLPLADGGIAKILLHAGLGGLLAEAMGGDFRAGALAGGANEVLVGLLGDKLLPPNLIEGTPEYDRAKANLLALSQIVGVLGAAANDSDVGIAAAVAANATQYNWLSHREIRIADEARSACAAKGGDVQGCQLAITRKMETLHKEREYELQERARAIQLQSLQEGGWSLEDYNKALYDDYFASKGLDKSEITFDGYDPAKTLGYMLSERGIGAANALIKWPGEVLGGIVSTVTHPLDTLAGAAQSVWSAAGSVAGWATSPIPAQGLERVGDQLLAQSEQQAGELIFDTVSGLITTTIGGVAVKWVGGKWVRAGDVNSGNVSSNLGLADYLLPDADFVGRGVVRPDLKDHLVDATRSGKQISGGHDLENFMQALTEHSGTSSRFEVAPGIYKVEYRLPNATKDAVKTVYDPKVYPDMANMANEAAHKALIQYQLTGGSVQEVVVGKVRFQVPINIRGEQVYVPTAFPIGVVK
ncbi:filamentous hemagglutinin N-terminal domain-containing protein [Pseudomonas cichorii]|nr:filamentous hemagglutinin N-terminal domain-containing protein [Pseudomonas cichorii]MBX8565618.1 filamentous hemagglutinin N-terminal domain-containing protein [Pseudomonas cichorii]